MDKEQLKKIQPYLCKAKPKKPAHKKEASLYIGSDGAAVVSSKSEPKEDLMSALKNRQLQERNVVTEAHDIKDLDTINKLLLVGPSYKVRSYTKAFFEKQKDEGYSILAYSGAMDHLRNIEHSPDFYTFSDPTSWNKTFKDLGLRHAFPNNGPNSLYKFIEKTSIIFLDMYEDFKELGFSSSSAKFQFNKTDTVTIYPTWHKVFAHCYSKPVNKSMITSHISPLDGTQNWRDNLLVYQGDNKHKHRFKKYTIDKFSAYLLPTVINYFKNLRDIRVIGFGEFQGGRAAKEEELNKLGFYEYIRSYILMLDNVKLNLHRYNISLEFLSEDSLYAWFMALNNVTSLKNTFPSYFSPKKTYLTERDIAQSKKLQNENTIHIGKFHS